MVAYLLLGVAQLVGLLLLPLGWPGVWVQLAGLGLFSWLTDFQPFGVIPLGLLFLLAVTAELLEPVLAGGWVEQPWRRRAGSFGFVGSLIGAGVGVAVPLLGTMFGVLLGSLVGTAVAGMTGVRSTPSGSGKGAGIGRVIAMGIRTAAGVATAAFILLTLIR